MKPFLITLLTLIALLETGKSYSQDTINLLDGHRIIANKTYIDSTNSLLKYDIVKYRINGILLTWTKKEIFYKILKKEVLKQKSIDKLEIYSITYPNRKQKMIYQCDTSLGFPLSTEEMGNYILGESEARKSYKVPLIALGGLVLGGIAADYIQFYALIEPVVYGTGMALFNPKVKTSENISPALKSDKDFVNGYKEIAIKKRVKNAIFASALGIVIVGVASEIINKY